jgi:hypothetical protein
VHQVTERWGCPVCGAGTAQDPGCASSLFRCEKGHVTNHATLAPRVELDVEASRRERLREIMPRPVEPMARGR